MNECAIYIYLQSHVTLRDLVIWCNCRSSCYSAV